MIRIQCPSCQRKLKLPRLPRHKKVVCPKCASKFKVKEASDGPDPAPVAVGRDSDDPFADVDSIIGRTESPRTPPEQPAAPTTHKVTRRGQVRPQRTPGSIRHLEEDLNPRDQTLKRNGMGLLILSLGLVALPFFAYRVDELQAVIPVAPWVGTGIAFIGSFMLALSQRKKNLAAVLLAGVFLLLVTTIGLGAHFLPPLLYDSTLAEQTEPAIDPDLAEDGWIVVDRDSLNNNPASQFVPPRRQPSSRRDESNEDPVKPKKDDSVSANKPNPVGVAESTFRPSDPIQPVSKQPQPTSEIRTQLTRASEIADNRDKREVLQRRVANRLLRGRVNRNQIQSPPELAREFMLSNGVGRETVFGLAYFDDINPVVGLDTAFAKNRDAGAFDLIVPIIDQAEFSDSIFHPTQDHRFVGLKVYLGRDGILGLQGQFLDTGSGARLSTGSWVGEEPPAGVEVAQIDAHDGRVHGVVIFKDQLKTVGLALILKR